jgi:hypothetical protein
MYNVICTILNHDYPHDNVTFISRDLFIGGLQNNPSLYLYSVRNEIFGRDFGP